MASEYSPKPWDRGPGEPETWIDELQLPTSLKDRLQVHALHLLGYDSMDDYYADDEWHSDISTVMSYILARALRDFLESASPAP